MYDRVNAFVGVFLSIFIINPFKCVSFFLSVLISIVNITTISIGFNRKRALFQAILVLVNAYQTCGGGSRKIHPIFKRK